MYACNGSTFLMTYLLSEIRGIVAFRSVREVKCGIIVKVAVVQ